MAFCITDINVITFPDDDPGVGCLLAATQNIDIVRGATFNMVFDLVYQTVAEDETVSSSPADLDGYSINMSVKQSSTSTTDLLFASTQNRMIDINYTTARVSVNIPVKYTLRLPLGSLYYLIRLVASDGNTQKIIQGIATVSDSSA
jgi:hypothetical protein